jgi:hypothetical protein
MKSTDFQFNDAVSISEVIVPLMIMMSECNPQEYETSTDTRDQ